MKYTDFIYFKVEKIKTHKKIKVLHKTNRDNERPFILTIFLSASSLQKSFINTFHRTNIKLAFLDFNQKLLRQE